MSSTPFILPRQTPVNGSGRPYASSTLTVYRAGTTTLATIYSNSARTVPLSNPLTSDAAGKFPPVYLDPSYNVRVIHKTSAGVTLSDDDNIGTSPELTAAGVGAVLYPVSASESAGGVTPTDYSKEWGDVRRYGAVGDGATDDTSALQAAIDSGHRVFGFGGQTYLTGSITADNDDQVIDFSGCTILAKANTGIVLTVSADNVRVIGGVWDGNKLLQTAVDFGYGNSPINVTGDDCTVESVTSQNSKGIGIKGAGCNRVTIKNCHVTGWTVQGIYVESTEADAYGNRIESNYVEITANTGIGIYLIGKADLSFRQRRFSISHNVVVGPSSGTQLGDICFTIRGEDGVIANNQTFNGSMGISADYTMRSTITGNRIGATNGGYGYGLEINGGYNTISGNYVKGCTYGFLGSAVSGTGLDQNGNAITGNVFEKPTSRAIYITGVNYPANYLAITGNVFIHDVASTGIYLTDNCKYALISGNQFVGPGSGVASSRAIYLDTVVSHVSIVGNRFSGWERPVGLYHASSTAYTNILFTGNDCSVDMTDQSTFLNTEGSATLGSSIVQTNNTISTGLGVDYINRGSNIIEMTGAGTPEGAVTAGIGSRYFRTDGSTSTTLYIKTSGTGNTGWTAK